MASDDNSRQREDHAMNPFLSLMRPGSTGWPASARPGTTRRAQPLPDIVIAGGQLYRSECFAEDLQATSDAALADLFPMLRARPAARAGR
jgi:hypothetical protein